MLAGLAPILAQVEVREEGSGATSCVAENEGFCPGYVVDNIDEYVSPTLEHVVGEHRGQLGVVGQPTLRVLGQKLAERLDCLFVQALLHERERRVVLLLSGLQ